MFTGIITDIGEIASAEQRQGEDLRLWIAAGQPLHQVAIGASIACSGVCLTVTAIEGQRFSVDVSGETVSRTVPGMWAEGRRLNLERALKVGDELGGHIVTGHVDGIGVIESITGAEGSHRFLIRAPGTLAGAIAAKGSITVDGVSLTVNAVEDLAGGEARFALNIIPHTAKMTTLGQAKAGDRVNLEMDVLARYLARMQQVHIAM